MIRTVLPLDREKTPYYQLTAHAQDAGMPEWECQSSVAITVTDINDNAPEFASSIISASLREDAAVGSVAAKVLATDKDALDNKKIQYSLITTPDSATFKIEQSTGLVSLAKPLDRETKSLYNLTVRAMDHGTPRLSSQASLIVTVLDVNDNPPEFASKFYFATAPENPAVGIDVVSVFAASKEAGVNAEITYSLIGGNERRRFEIDPKTGAVLIAAPLDYEKATEYFLTIQAQDGGDPPLSNHATANITIGDVNDNSPTFSKTSYSSLISESAQIGTEVVTVKASDLDSGVNGRVSYSIVSGDRHNQFSINAVSGKIKVSGPLDREMVASYVLEVQAVDAGVPDSLSTTVLVTIGISDANDNPPIFPEGNYTAFLPEDRRPGYVVHRFSVTDADDSPNGAPFTFDLRSGNEDGAFRMVQDGSLRTAEGHKFDHRNKPKYVLQVRAYDGGSPSLFSDSYLTVNIIEESKFPPVVVPLKTTIRSYQDGGVEFPGASVGKVKASDRDPHDRLTYDIVQSHRQSRLFEIGRDDGLLVALRGLDVGSYSVNVSVSDGKFTTYSEGKVDVEPITDEMLDEATIVRFSSITPEDFLENYSKPFVKLVRNAMGVKAKQVVILGVQSARKLAKRHSPIGKAVEEKNKSGKDDTLEVLFLIRRSSKSFYSREKVRQALEDNNLRSAASKVGLTVVGIQSDECLVGQCGEDGECQDTVEVGSDVVSVSTLTGQSFVGPRFEHAAVCRCDEGFAGDKCDVATNECARRPCPTFKVCAPDQSSFQVTILLFK